MLDDISWLMMPVSGDAARMQNKNLADEFINAPMEDEFGNIDDGSADA